MNASQSSDQAPLSQRLGLTPWLQRFLTIIAGAVVAVIAWTVIERFMHILILLLASFLIAYLLGPLVDRLDKPGIPRLGVILGLYVIILGALTLAGILLVGPLTTQLQSLTTTLPTLIGGQSNTQSQIDQFLQQQGIPFSVADLENQITGYITSAGTSLLGGTLAVVTGLVGFVTDLLLILVITFYFLLDGSNMHRTLLRFLPDPARDRWFFVEAAVNRVLGGYIRGQLIVAATVGVAAGVGSGILQVHYALVIGLLAFIFEFIPMFGPVLGMIPAVVISLFQMESNPGIVWWVIIYFIILQQVESNVIVPRVSGHAVGLHPLAALLALITGFELGGIGGALLAVPVAGILFVVSLALYSDATGQTQLLATEPRRGAVTSIRDVISRRRPESQQSEQPKTTGASVTNEQLNNIAEAKAQLVTQYAQHEAEDAAAQAAQAAQSAANAANDAATAVEQQGKNSNNDKGPGAQPNAATAS